MIVRYYQDGSGFQYSEFHPNTLTWVEDGHDLYVFLPDCEREAKDPNWFMSPFTTIEPDELIFDIANWEFAIKVFN